MELQFSSQMAEFERVLDDSKAVLEHHSIDCDPMWAPLSRLVNSFDALYRQSNSQATDIRNLEELKQDLIDELEVISEIDGLTGLWNVCHFTRGLDYELRRSSRSQRAVSMMLIEIDFFQEFEQHYGHSASELCLKRIGGQLTRVLNRPYDIVARYDAEQFVCMLPETDNIGAMTVANSILKRIADLDVLHESSEVAEIITISVGLLTRVPKRGDGPDGFTSATEALLKQACDAGRNQIVVDDQTPFGN